MVALSVYHFCHGEAELSYWGIVELNVTVYNIKMLSVAQKCCYGEFIRIVGNNKI